MGCYLCFMEISMSNHCMQPILWHASDGDNHQHQLMEVYCIIKMVYD
jgi:hypothetical protein